MSLEIGNRQICPTTPFTQMGRIVRFEFFTSFYLYLPFTKAYFPCPLVMASDVPSYLGDIAQDKGARQSINAVQA